jgi:hypothetical protein
MYLRRPPHASIHAIALNKVQDAFDLTQQPVCSSLNRETLDGQEKVGTFW